MTELITLFLMFLPAWAAADNGIDVQEIVEKANRASYYAGKDGRADVTMTIHDGKGGARERAFTILRLNTRGADQKFYVYFKEPADVRKMAYLVWKNANRDDDRWLWLPAMNLVKRIAPGDKRTSFVGSDFVYEDVSGRGTEEDHHVLIKETDTQYHLKSTPKDAGSVEFSYYELWIDKTTHLPRKAEYYDKQGKLYRRVEALKVEQIDDHPTVVESKVSDLVTGGYTINRFTNVSYDNGYNERIFTERFLRRPPREIR
ncbi:MAG: outer membrane lipoprotein-sorting protein [Acidobacteriota bacterium]|nr:outer membrane lipoprotein-sorting protein [Acidobacteriota bacterium]